MRIPVALVGVFRPLIYFAGAPVAMRVSIRWPAPYWFAIGLSGFSISLLIGSRWPHVLWGGALGIASACATWFADIGAYHVCGFKQAYASPWSGLLKIPGYLCLGLLVLTCRRGRSIGIARSLCAAGVFLISYLAFMSVAEVVCNIALPRGGTFLHGNYDIFGYRLGMYTLTASFMCALLMRFVCFQYPPRSHTIDEKAEPCDSANAG
jgi:hypothetical protein